MSHVYSAFVNCAKLLSVDADGPVKKYRAISDEFLRKMPDVWTTLWGLASTGDPNVFEWRFQGDEFRAMINLLAVHFEHIHNRYQCVILEQ